jgi:hypothetical protein
MDIDSISLEGRLPEPELATFDEKNAPVARRDSIADKREQGTGQLFCTIEEDATV